MKKLTQEEIDDFIMGKGLVEISATNTVESDRILTFLKKKGAYIATSAGTFKVSKTILNHLKEMGFVFDEVKEEKLPTP